MGKKETCQGNEQTNERRKGKEHEAVQLLIEIGYLSNEPFDIDLIGFDGLIEILVVIAFSFLRRFHAGISRGFRRGRAGSLLL